MFIEQVLTGGDRNFGYLVADEEEKKAIVIDPSFSPERLVELARARKYEILYVFNTHHCCALLGPRLSERARCCTTGHLVSSCAIINTAWRNDHGA